MKQAWYRVDSVREAGNNIFILTLDAPGLAGTVRAGQFLNIKTRDFFVPLLRRPFSVHRVTGGKIEILFNIVGLGTQILAASRNTDKLDVLGPLGNHFGIDDDFGDAILVAGGLGVAPMPILTAELQRAGKKIFTFLGARDAGQVVREGLENLHIATDDGSEGHRGTVVDLLGASLRKGTPKFTNPKIFSCGPTPMLRALASLAAEKSLSCEISLESPMACGIGICQGCPVELKEGGKKYALVCKDGTVFPGNSVVF